MDKQYWNLVLTDDFACPSDVHFQKTWVMYVGGKQTNRWGRRLPTLYFRPDQLRIFHVERLPDTNLILRLSYEIFVSTVRHDWEAKNMPKFYQQQYEFDSSRENLIFARFGEKYRTSALRMTRKPRTCKAVSRRRRLDVGKTSFSQTASSKPSNLSPCTH